MPRRVRTLLWNPTEDRARMPVRLVATILLFVLLSVLAFVVLNPVFRALGIQDVSGDPTTGTPGGIAASLLVSTLVTLGGVVIAGRTIDQRYLSDFGFRDRSRWQRHCLVGLGLGAGLQTLIFLVGLAGDWVAVTGFFHAAAGRTFLPWFLLSLVVFVPAAVAEEVLMRGYVLTNVAEGLAGVAVLGERGAVATATLVSSLVFGVGHLANPNASLLSVAAISLAGVMLALGYLFTGELGLPVGLHIGWNVFQGSVYGFPVSGTGFGVSIVGTELTGPTPVTGGAFGPEAGWLGLAAILLGAGVTVGYVWWEQSELKVAAGLTRPALRDHSDDAA